MSAIESDQLSASKPNSSVTDGQNIKLRPNRLYTIFVHMSVNFSFGNTMDSKLNKSRIWQIMILNRCLTVTFVITVIHNEGYAVI